MHVDLYATAQGVASSAIGGAVGAGNRWMAYQAVCSYGSGCYRFNFATAMPVAVSFSALGGAVIGPRVRSKGGVAGAVLVLGVYAPTLLAAYYLPPGDGRESAEAVGLLFALTHFWVGAAMGCRLGESCIGFTIFASMPVAIVEGFVLGYVVTGGARGPRFYASSTGSPTATRPPGATVQ